MLPLLSLSVSSLVSSLSVIECRSEGCWAVFHSVIGNVEDGCQTTGYLVSNHAADHWHIDIIGAVFIVVLPEVSNLGRLVLLLSIVVSNWVSVS